MFHDNVISMVDRKVISAAMPVGAGAPGESLAIATSARPSFLHGWNFLSFVASDDPDAIAVRGSACDEGPAVIYNPTRVSREELEDPETSSLWLCPVLCHIAYAVIVESLSSFGTVNRFTSEAWESFRGAASRYACMDWEEIMVAAQREGVDFMSEHLALSLFVESGLEDSLLGGPAPRGGPEFMIA